MVSRVIPVDDFDLVIFAEPAIWRGGKYTRACSAGSEQAR